MELIQNLQNRKEKLTPRVCKGDSVHEVAEMFFSPTSSLVKLSGNDYFWRVKSKKKRVWQQ